ncbi:MAG: hypothetical protein HYX94_03260 [Chloroflexi bacterium]|nr:hypothetical protein [Chloroflexota bacterium]
MDEKLVSGQAGVLVVEGVDFQVLDELAKDLGQFELSPSIAADLYGDAPKVLGHMADLGILRTVDSKPLALPAFVIACLYAIPLYDALSVALAANSGCPLLVADEDLYETLRIIQADRPALRVVWLSEV